MNTAAISSMLVLLAMVFPGCGPAQPPAGPMDFAPIFQQPAPWQPGMPALPDRPAELPKAVKAGPQITIRARFLAAPADRPRHFGLVPAEDVLTIPEAECHKRCRRARHGLRELRTLIAPRMTVFPGRRAFVTVQTQEAYVQDCEYLPNAEHPPPQLKPIVGVVGWGTALEISARLDGDRVVFTVIKPAVRALLARRHCSAKVALGGEPQTVTWQEPVVLAATARLDDPCEISLGTGQCVLVKMGYRVEQSPAAAVRALAVDGEVHEQYVPDYSPLARGAAPACVQHVLVLAARKIQPDQPQPPEPPKVEPPTPDEPK